MLLFEFYITIDGKPMAKRTCEERIIIVQANSAAAALREAVRKGRASQFRFRNTDGDPGHFRFVGIMDLLHLGSECDANEVWYDITERLRPSERRATILPRPQDLNAFRTEALLRRKNQGQAGAKALPNYQMQQTGGARRRPRRARVGVGESS